MYYSVLLHMYIQQIDYVMHQTGTFVGEIDGRQLVKREPTGSPSSLCREYGDCRRTLD